MVTATEESLFEPATLKLISVLGQGRVLLPPTLAYFSLIL